jgi:hypothetical protein
VKENVLSMKLTPSNVVAGRLGEWHKELASYWALTSECPNPSHPPANRRGRGAGIIQSNYPWSDTVAIQSRSRDAKAELTEMRLQIKYQVHFQ